MTKKATPTFLGPGATVAQRIRASAENHTDCFVTNALAAGGEVRREQAMLWTWTPDEAIIPFPHESGAALDTVIAECRQRKPRCVACWSQMPSRPRDLGAKLAARGFEWGWKPHWMSLDLSQFRDDFPVPDGLRIAVDNDADWDVDDLPYYTRRAGSAPNGYSTVRENRWHFGAWLEGKLVGHCILHVTTGRWGAAGIYDVGTVPPARNRGVGRAVTAAACRFAREIGCHYALLNSATSIYDRIGFESLGYGQTWWMHAPALAAPPSAAEVAFAEAIGVGDTAALEVIRDRRGLPENLDAPLTSGMTPMDLAVRAGQPRSARWLAAQGATLSVLDAWDLGWRRQVPGLLAKNPALVNQRTGAGQGTPLHAATMRGDVELARALLEAGADLAIADTEYSSTPLGWARHFGRAEIIAMIEARTGRV